MKKNKFYIATNCIFIAASIFFFAHLVFCTSKSIKYTIFFVPQAIFVHFLKAFRLRILLAGEKIELRRYIKIFCKTAIISVLLPFKSGELFRIYSFALLTKKGVKGTAIILLDRFSDLAALLVIFAIFKFSSGVDFNFVFYVSASFEAIIFLLYLVMPEILFYWHEYLMSAEATRQHFKELSFVAVLRFVHSEIKKLAKGKFFAMFFISLLAWITEISALIFSLRTFSDEIPSVFSKYLFSALTGKDFLQQKLFVFTSVMILGIVGAFSKIRTDKIGGEEK